MKRFLFFIVLILTCFVSYAAGPQYIAVMANTNGTLGTPTNFFGSNLIAGANVTLSQGEGGKVTIASSATLTPTTNYAGMYITNLIEGTNCVFYTTTNVPGGIMTWEWFTNLTKNISGMVTNEWATNINRTIYVATNGNNAWPGTMLFPVATLSNALTKVTQDANIWMYPGTYIDNTILHTQLSNSPAIQCADKQRLIIDGPGARIYWPNGLMSGLHMSNCTDILVRNITMQGYRDPTGPPAAVSNAVTLLVFGMIEVADCQRITFDNITLKDGWDHGILVDLAAPFSTYPATNGIVIRNSHFENFGMLKLYNPPATNDWDGAGCVISGGALVANNTFFNCSSGIEAYRLVADLPLSEYPLTIIIGNMIQNSRSDGLNIQTIPVVATGNRVTYVNNTDYPINVTSLVHRAIWLQTSPGAMVSANSFQGHRYGAFVGNATNVTFANNYISRGDTVQFQSGRNDRFIGNVISDFPRWWFIQDIRDCDISDNLLLNVGTNGAASGSVQCGGVLTNVTFRGNKIRNDVLNAYGLYVDPSANATNLHVIDNEFVGSTAEYTAPAGTVSELRSINGILMDVDVDSESRTNLVIRGNLGNVGIALGDEDSPFGRLALQVEGTYTLGLMDSLWGTAYGYKNLRSSNIYSSGTLYGTNGVVTPALLSGGSLVLTNYSEGQVPHWNATFGRFTNATPAAGTGGATNWSAGHTNATQLAIVSNGTNSTGAIKTIEAGSNVTIVEGGNTNLVISASLAGGAASMEDVTNVINAIRNTNSQAAYVITNLNMQGPALSYSPTASNSPSANELVSAQWVRTLLASGAEYYVSTNIDLTATNPSSGQVMYKFQSTLADLDTGTRNYATTGELVDGGYIGSVITTNTFASLGGNVAINSYIGFSGGSSTPTLTLKPELYYSYDKTNWYGDYSGSYQNIVYGQTNIYSWAIIYPNQSATNATGFYVQRRFKVGTVTGSGTRTLSILIGTNYIGGIASASHIHMQSPAATVGNAYLANNQTFTGSNWFSSQIGALQTNGPTQLVRGDWATNIAQSQPFQPTNVWLSNLQTNAILTNAVQGSGVITNKAVQIAANNVLSNMQGMSSLYWTNAQASDMLLSNLVNNPYTGYTNSSAWQASSMVLSNIVGSGALTNPSAYQASSMVLSNIVGSGAITNKAAQIAANNVLSNIQGMASFYWTNAQASSMVLSNIVGSGALTNPSAYQASSMVLSNLIGTVSGNATSILGSGTITVTSNTGVYTIAGAASGGDQYSGGSLLLSNLTLNPFVAYTNSAWFQTSSMVLSNLVGTVSGNATSILGSGSITVSSNAGVYTIGGGGSGTPGGGSFMLQFNNGGAFAGLTNSSATNDTGTLGASNVVLSGNLTVAGTNTVGTLDATAVYIPGIIPGVAMFDAFGTNLTNLATGTGMLTNNGSGTLGWMTIPSGGSGSTQMVTFAAGTGTITNALTIYGNLIVGTNLTVSNAMSIPTLNVNTLNLTNALDGTTTNKLRLGTNDATLLGAQVLASDGTNHYWKADATGGESGTNSPGTAVFGFVKATNVLATNIWGGLVAAGGTNLYEGLISGTNDAYAYTRSVTNSVGTAVFGYVKATNVLATNVWAGLIAAGGTNLYSAVIDGTNDAYVYTRSLTNQPVLVSSNITQNATNDAYSYARSTTNNLRLTNLVDVAPIGLVSLASGHVLTFNGTWWSNAPVAAATTDYAELWARTNFYGSNVMAHRLIGSNYVQLLRGTPTVGQVFTATNTDGSGMWKSSVGDLQMNNMNLTNVLTVDETAGKIKFDGSPYKSIYGVGTSLIFSNSDGGEYVFDKEVLELRPVSATLTNSPQVSLRSVAGGFLNFSMPHWWKATNTISFKLTNVQAGDVFKAESVNLTGGLVTLTNGPDATGSGDWALYSTNMVADTAQKITGFTNLAFALYATGGGVIVLTNIDQGDSVEIDGSGVTATGSGYGPIRLYTGTQVTNVIASAIPSIVTNSIWVPSGAMAPYGGSTADGGRSGATAGSFTNVVAVDTWDMDDTTNECVAFTWQPGPDFAGEILTSIYWLTTNSLNGASNVVWDVGVSVLASNSLVTANTYQTDGTFRFWSSNSVQVAKLNKITTTGQTYDTLLAFRVSRLGTNTADAAVGDARLLGARIGFTRTNWLGGYP